MHKLYFEHQDRHPSKTSQRPSLLGGPNLIRTPSCNLIFFSILLFYPRASSYPQTRKNESLGLYDYQVELEMDSKSEINLERPTHAWVSNGKSLSTRSLKLGQLLFSVKNQFTAILERVELCASRSHPIRRLTHCGYRARTVAAVKIPEYQFEGYLVVVVDRGQGMVMAFGFLCCHLAPSYCSSFVFALLLLKANSMKHRSHESFGRRGSGMFIGTLPGMSTSGRCPAWSSGRCPAWSSESLLRHVL